MNIIFLTLFDFKSYNEHNIYCDLLREFIKHGHEVYCISPAEKRTGVETHTKENGHLLKLRIGNTQKTSIIEKGISTLMIEPQFLRAIKKYFSHIKFDLVLYSTPPITLAGAIQYIKKRDGATTYLMLKDIFPQNAVDIGMMTQKGIKGILYNFFRRKEKKLYAISDRIGCMSQANVEYLLKHNPDVAPSKAEICPNAIEPQDMRISEEERVALRQKYGIPLDKKIFVYGGNLGRPQGIPFLTECLKAEKENKQAFFLIVGDGTEYKRLEAFFAEEKLSNAKLLNRLPKEDYDKMVAACDIGMIFLDHRFTIPNFPSRLLAYIQAGLPVLSCTDPNTDIGQVIVNNGFGFACESNDVSAFSSCVAHALDADTKAMHEAGIAYLYENYTTEKAYKTIMQ